MDTDLSVIILSYNTLQITRQCLTSLLAALEKTPRLKTQVIVVDNASSDGSVEMLKKFKVENPTLNLLLIFNKKNSGYTKGNNQAIEKARGRYILFLNSDVIVKNVNFQKLIQDLDEDKQTAALTVKVILENGDIDPASHRGFPTLWNSFTYFMKLEKLFGRIPYISRLFGGYHLTYLNLDIKHQIDSPTGAFYLVKKEILNIIGNFDDHNFFMYGEDLDLSYRIKETGYKILYDPQFYVVHLKYKSGLKKNDKEVALKTKGYFYDAMKTFYKKHYEKKHFWLINNTVYFFIDLKKKLT